MKVRVSTCNEGTCVHVQWRYVCPRAMKVRVSTRNEGTCVHAQWRYMCPRAMKVHVSTCNEGTCVHVQWRYMCPRAMKVHVSTCNEGIEEEWKWRWKGSFKLRRLYRRGKNTRHTLNRMGGSQRRYGRFGENGHAWNQTHRLARSVVTIYHHSDKIWVFYEERSQNCEKRLLASSCLSVCMAVRMEQLGSHKSLCLPIFFFRKSVDKIRIL